MNKVKCFIFALPLLLVWQSCTKESTPVNETAESSIEPSYVMEWTQEDIDLILVMGAIPYGIELPADFELPQVVSERGKGNDDCNCAYKITDISVDLPNPTSETEKTRFYAENTDCAMNCGYYDDVHCSSTNSCNDEWTEFPPTDFSYAGDIGFNSNQGFRNFNCDVPRYSTFDTRFTGLIGSGANCINSSSTTGFIKFKIYCVEEEGQCGSQGYGFVSPEITLDLSSGSVGGFSAPQTVDIGGTLYPGTPNEFDCGCIPILQ